MRVHRFVDDLCMIRLKDREEGSACLGRRSCVTVPSERRSMNFQRLQYPAASEAPAGGQAGAARRCRRAGHLREVVRYAEVFLSIFGKMKSLGGRS